MKQFYFLCIAMCIAAAMNCMHAQSWYGDPNQDLRDVFYRFDITGNTSGSYCVDQPSTDPSATTITDPIYGKHWQVFKPYNRKRAELARSNGYNPAENDVFYLGYRWKISSTPSLNKEIAVFQCKTDDGGGAFTNTQNYPYNMEYDGTYLTLNCYGPGNPDWTEGSSIKNRKTTIWKKAVAANTWVRLVIRVKVSKNKSTGFIEFWFNGVQQTLMNSDYKDYQVTLSSDKKRAFHKTNDGKHTYFKWGSYNQNACEFAVTTSYDDMRIATSLAGAQPSAPPSSGNPIVHIRKRNAMDYAMDGGNDGVNGQNVKLFSQDISNVNQQWEEINRGSGYYSYKKINTNYCLDGGHGGVDGQNAKLWTCSSSNENQHWKKIDTGNGHYRLQKRNAVGFSLSGGAGGADEQNIKLWSNSTTNYNQQWKFTHVGLKSSSIFGEDQTTSLERDQMVIYPNPVTDQLNIDFGDREMEQAVVMIYELSGKLVLQQVVFNQQVSIAIDHLAKGVYIIQLTSDDFDYKEKVVKQ